MKKYLNFRQFFPQAAGQRKNSALRASSLRRSRYGFCGFYIGNHYREVLLSSAPLRYYRS
jgi:hypothetical protein